MRKWLPLVAISLSTFMLLVDLTIVSIAGPALANGLDASLSELQWTVDIYVLVLAATMMAVGSTSDLLGHRRVFIGGLVVFAVASLACGLAPNIHVLVAARAVQGLGAAAMYATNVALLNSIYKGRDRGMAFGVWGAANGAAAAAGPILGGVLTEQFGWRAIFLVNLPVVAITVPLALRGIQRSRPLAGRRIDLLGTFTFTVAASAVVYGLIRVAEHGWTDKVSTGAIGAGVVTGIVFVLVERRHSNPLIDLSLFRQPSFSTLMVGGAVLTASAFGSLVFVSLWAQSVRGLGPISAGLALTPLAAVGFVVSAVGGRLLHRVAPRHSIGWGLLLVGAGALLQMQLGPDSGWAVLVPGLAVTGLGVGLASPVLASAALSAVPPHRAGMANGAMNTFRQMGFAVAIPIFATVASAEARDVLGPSDLFTEPDAASGQLIGGGYAGILEKTPPETRDAVDQLLRSAYAAGLDEVFLLSGIVALVAGIAVLAIVRSPGQADGPEPAESAAVASPSIALRAGLPLRLSSHGGQHTNIAGKGPRLLIDHRIDEPADRGVGSGERRMGSIGGGDV
ncbi:MFS transporter [Micromonospora sp. NPDC005324]|uniref:MFS transporter n=1 Tax=Micromonospora sp. NPDC005324 TaxID=3157033 RepID=UPI0033B6C965